MRRWAHWLMGSTPVGLTLVGLALLDLTPSATGDRSADGPALPPLAAQLSVGDHTRLFIDFVEISGKLGPGEQPRVAVEVNGRAAWAQLLDGSISVFRLGPVVAPPRSSFAIAVSKQQGDLQHLVAKVGFRDPGGAITKKRFAEGGLTELSLVVSPVDVWVVPEIAVVAPGALGDDARALMTAALIDFDQRLADLSDGQIRIARFAVYEPPLPPGISATGPGVIRLEPAATGCADGRGRPRQPTAMPLHLDLAASPALLGSQLVHQFGHAYLGLEDEALADGGNGCPVDEPDQAAGPACFMNPPAVDNRLVCRAADHDGARDTAQNRVHHRDCWQRMTTLLFEDVGLTLLGDAPFSGPPLAASPAISFSGQPPVVDFGSDGKPLDSAVIDPVIASHGGPLGRCLIASGRATSTVHFVIRGIDGRVTRVEVDGATTGDLASCVSQVMVEMRFPTGAATTTADFQLSR